MTIFGRMAAAILAAGSTAPKNDFNLERLYPYLVPAGYPTAATDRELGNGLRVALVVENSPLTIRNVTDVELKKAGLSPAQADPAFRKEMRALVRKNESDGAKPLTFDLFQLTERGPAPLVE